MPKRIKVFVIEDDFGIREMLCRVLEVTPYAYQSPSCEEALTYIEDHPEFWYLLFVDLFMPGMSGWEFLERVKPLRARRIIRLVVITGLNSSRWGDAALNSDKIITKPFNIEDIIREVDLYFQQLTQSKENSVLKK